ncbi:MAG: thiol-activated cytolysin family protein [Bacteroidota bacterium]
MMKTNQSHTRLLIFMAVFMLLFMSCSSDSDDPEMMLDDDPISQDDDGPAPTSFNAVVEKGGEFEEFPQSRTDDVLEEGEPYADDYTSGTGSDSETLRFICTSRTVSVTDGTGDFQTLGGVASEIFPGALLQGKTINDVKPQGIPLKRAGGSISYNLNDGNPEASQDLDEMSESKVRQAMNDIIAGSSGVVPANFDLDYENVFSEKQVALQMGLSFEGYGVKAEGKLSFSKDQSYNRVLVRLYQSYYDVSYDFPTSYDDVFDSSVTPADLDRFIQPDNPATYIKKVTYGRIFYMLIESTSSLEVMNTQIDASYKSFDKEIEGNLETDSMEKMENIKIKVIAYGGDSQNTFSGLGETNIGDLADMLAASTDIRTGLPLSYEVYSLEDPSKQVGTNISTEMEVVECQLKGVLPPVLYSNLVDLFEDGIGAATQIQNEYTAIFNGAGTDYVIFDASSGAVSDPYSIKDASAPLGVTTFDSVGAALRQFLDEIYIFNEQGTEFEVLEYDYNGVQSMPMAPIGTYRQRNGTNRRWVVNDNFSSENEVNSNFADGSFIGPEGRDVDCVSFPLFGKGIKAAARLDRYEQPVGIYTESFFTSLIGGEVTSSYFFPMDTNGTTYSRRNYYNPYSVTTPSGPLGFGDFNCWESEKDLSEVRGSVEAACKMNINGNSIQRILYFTTDGLMSIRNLVGEDEGPYAL